MLPSRTGLRVGSGVLLMLTILAGCGAGDEGQGNDQQQERQSAPRKAQVMEMQRRDIGYDRTYSAKLRSEQEAVVIARVRGLLEERHFTPGELVDEGEPLYTIEPDIYRATVNQREADLQSAQAEANLAQREAERFRRLFQQNSVSEQDRDQAVAELQMARANVAQAEAALESAQVDLNYTDVEAPVSGMISLSDVNVGNVVDVGTELATITPLDPVEVRFSLPQEDAFDLRRQRRQGGEITATLDFPGIRNGELETLEGELDFLGSRVDDDTSTVQARAMFDNPDELLMPGQFVRVVLENMKRYDVMAVPEIAVTQGLMGPQVFVLDEDDEARARNVTLGESAGPLQIIADGLEPGDRVIVSDPGGLQAGARIDPQPYSGDPAELSAQKEHPSKPGRGNDRQAASGSSEGQENNE
ncbi:membrane fusion protein, multidrug efflux system [Modicisalibacter ilicicola DSM 19980]|uniref:Membrane fusion protein, multidrug efflux system n=1 Tax=Modicisalibacter ilicicola DSM 19980 TaxID=1121942 RepID=A0A1M4T3R0_9GAMM|nr:efflux RND transporter periplasmic adaptor subunit [Halomonas ilicicola]SHE39090.1 membrane fusion protein, multidrug efflux system [Halomonas ilicicola DSM 19980]